MKLFTLCAVLFFVFVVLVMGCLGGKPIVVVTNNSEVLLKNVTIDGEGNPWSVTVGDLPSGGSRTLLITMKRDSGLRIRFEIDGKEFERGDLAYLEAKGGYEARLVIRDGPDVDCRHGSTIFRWGRLRF